MQDHEKEKAAPSENVLTALAMAEISLPWIAYEALVPTPDDFWGFRGVIFLVAACVGLIMLGFAWYFNHETSGRRDFFGGCADD